MISLVIAAILSGLFISIVLIGPVFFLLIETSLTKGVRPAIALETGVVAADILCIYIAHKSSRGLLDFIDAHPSIYMLGGFVVFIYGLYNIMSRGNLHIKGGSDIVTANYFKTFLNGFLLNLVNIGVIVFWITTIFLISTQYPKQSELYLYLLVMMSVMIAVDMLKIFLANKFQHKLTDRLVYQIKKIVGMALVIFGIVIFSKSFIKTSPKSPFQIIEKRNHNNSEE